MTVSLLLSITWACVVPAFQVPDEQVHFSYVQSLVERQTLPGDPSRPPYSTQMLEAMAAVNSDQVASQIRVKPEWSDFTEQAWEAGEEQSARNDGGGPNPAETYPPVSYLWMGLGYGLASTGSVFDMLLGARLMSALWLPITVLGTWLLAGEVFGRRRLLQIAAAGVPAFAPMVAFMTGGVNPDGMLYAIWALALWLGVRAIRRNAPATDAAAFFALVGLACVIKTMSIALLPGACLVAVLCGWMRRHCVWDVARLAAATLVPLALTLGLWVIVARLSDRPAAGQVTQVTQATGVATGSSAREFLSYLWQFYLPKTPVQNAYPFPSGSGLPLIDVWITYGWAAFGWLEVKFSGWVYWLLTGLTAALALGAAAALVRARRRLDLRVVAFLALVFVALVGGLHWTDYTQLESGARGFMQTRYLFPIIALFGVAFAGALSLVPVRQRPTAVAVMIAALLVFHLLSLGLVLQRFYA
jgi:4-amino-4-deoxy-L-arabinose transferase-like glycosyltransferase